MKQEILALIAVSPNIRTVEIADRADIDPDQVRPYIAAEIASGEIVEEEITAPNGKLVQSFRRADAPRIVVAGPVPALLPARVARTMSGGRVASIMASRQRPVQKAAASPVAVAPEPASVATMDIDVPVTRKEGPLSTSAQACQRDGKADELRRQSMTRVGLAIECLRAADGQPVPTDMLRRAMGLPRTSHPSSYLTGAVNDGRVRQESKMWYLGPASFDEPHGAELHDGMAVSVEVSCASTGNEVARPTQVEPVARIGGTNGYPIPPVADGAPNISRPGLYVDGEFRASPEVFLAGSLGAQSVSSALERHSDSMPLSSRTDTAHAPVVRGHDQAIERFVAGVLSDGSLHLRIPGMEPLDLPPEHASALYQFMRTHGYAAWKQTA